MIRAGSAVTLVLGLGGIAASLAPVSAPASKPDFSADIKPILRAHCLRCHDANSKMGGLSLASVSDLMKGGASGRVVFPGRSAQSTLLARIEGKGGKPQMPMGFAALSAQDISTIQAWIDQGCMDSGRPAGRHWAYVKPVRPKIPAVKTQGWVRNPIDAFVLARLEKEGLKPSHPADKVTLIRRVTLDLTGLPPTPAEVDAFVADRSSNAYEKLVDRLFASPHYGEKMALPWLDAARYADSNGFQQDGDTFQYVWRDWVVNAMNANMPYDQFTVEQLAGDLLPNASEKTPEGQALLVATAFNRNNMLNGEGGAIPEEQRNVALFDRVDTTATTWLGLTLACARCHDHKYDPFTQRDYYRLMAYFNNVPESGIVGGDGQYRIAEPFIYVGSPAELAKVKDAQAAIDKAQKDLKTLKDAPKKDLDAADAKVNAAQKSFNDLQQIIPRVMVMSDAQPRETHIYSRGLYTTPLDKVTCGTPDALPPLPPGAISNRLALANWIVSPDNPLTARVEVNRIWQIFFGQGLVRTPENFGVQGEPPTHPELLDWLAVDFRESGWNVKRLQKMIVMSQTYRQSSRVTPQLQEKDPDNRLLARGARFRLPSMLLRDDALAASGLLNPKMGGKPVYPYQPKGIWDGLAITDERDFTYPQSTGADLYRRSLYSFWRRTVAPGDMFDSATRQVCTVRASHTSTPMHALTTMNDVVWVEAGRVLAEHVTHDIPQGDEKRLEEAFRRVCARRPQPTELAILDRALNRARTAFRNDPDAATAYLNQGASKADPQIDKVEDAALATVCTAIFNLDEALTKE